MFKFTFSKKADAINPEIPLLDDDDSSLNLENRRIQELQSKGIEEHKERKRRDKKRFAEIDRPYGILHGDPRSMLSRMSDPSMITFHHSSMKEHRDQRDPTGRLKVHVLREALSNPSSGYARTVIPVTSYGHRPDLVKLAPRGLEVFMPVSQQGHSGTRAGISPAMREVRRIADMKAKKKLLLSLTDGTGVDELDPNHPLNILNNEGPEAALSAMFTDSHQYAKPVKSPISMSTETCVCGAHQDDHVSEEEAIAHHAATGEHKEIHKFSPQFISRPDGSMEDARNFRAGKYFLRNLLGPKSRSDNPETSEVALIRADAGMDIPHIPVVNVGTRSGILKRLILQPTGYDKYGKPMARNFFQKQPNDRPQACKGTKYQPCYGGKLTPKLRNNKVNCDCCEIGKEIFDGETGKPVSIGLGNGRVRILNEEDCPTCPDCNGDKFKLINDKTRETKVPCRTCKSTGKDLSAMSKRGIACSNCNSDNSTINTTDVNDCPICNGTGISPFQPLRKKKQQKKQVEVVNPEEKSFEGNIEELIPYDPSGHSNTGVDGWKAHGNQNCTRCHGDDEYQTDNGMPCNCRIGSFDDASSLIAPKGLRFVLPTSVKIPSILYQKAIAKNYKNNKDANPHSRLTDFDAINPDTGLEYDNKIDGNDQIQYNKVGDSTSERIGKNRFLSIYTSGVTLPESTMARLKQRSEKHRASRNAEFCAGSAELEDLHDVFSEHFGEFPMIIPGLKVSRPRAKRRQDRSVDASALHPRVQQAIPKLENAIANLGDQTGELQQSAQYLYDAASGLEHVRDAGKDTDDKWDIYESAVNNLLSQTVKIHGDKNARKVQKSLEGFPSVRTRQPEPASTEDASERTDVE